MGGTGGAGAGGSSGRVTAEPDGYARNPIISHIFTADPSARVFGDRVYLYASHDPDDQTGYAMVDYHIFSSADLVNWQDHGVGLHEADVTWAGVLYAPDCCHSSTTGKYYLYFPDAGSAIGVAVSDSPAGPFVDALGRPLITRNTPGVRDVDWLFDPSCFIDDDGQGYLYFGGGPEDTGDNARVIRLGPDMISVTGSAVAISAPDFFEASYMHKRDGKYYFSYSTNFSKHSAYIDYMMSDDPMTGFVYAGTILPNPAGNNGNNNHHSIIEFGGKSYIFYHNRVLANRDGFSVYQRSVTLDNLTYDAQGKVVQVSATQGRVAQVRSVDALARMEVESMAAQRGVEIDLVERDGERDGVAVTYIDNQDWIGYSQLDFGEGATRMHVRAASAGAGGSIEVLVGGCSGFTEAAGELAGTCSIVPTGGWQTWTDVMCSVDVPAGVHDICLRFTGSETTPLFNLDWFRFE